MTLCNSCHAKTNAYREFYKNYFKKNHKTYSMVIGRFQCLPPHEGHLQLIKKLLNNGKNVFIALRKEDGKENDPYSQHERLFEFEKLFSGEILEGKVIVGFIPDIEEVVYGRAPGWKIREIHLEEEIEKISATKMRKSSK